MGCFNDMGYGSQEELEEFYRRKTFAEEVVMYFAYSPDRSQHYTLLLDHTDNSVGLVCPGQDEVEEWFGLDPNDDFYEPRTLEEVLSQVPEGYTLENTHGSRVTRESLLRPSDVLSEL